MGKPKRKDRVTIGGVVLEVEGLSIGPPSPGFMAEDRRSRASRPPKPSVTWTFTWEPDPLFDPWTWARLEDRRWASYLMKRFMKRPGIRFADLVRGVGRN